MKEKMGRRRRWKKDKMGRRTWMFRCPSGLFPLFFNDR